MSDLTFRSYKVQDAGIEMVFTNFAPGAGLPNDYTVYLTDAEVDSATTNQLLRALVIAKLRRKLQALNISDRLDPLVGQTVTI